MLVVAAWCIIDFSLLLGRRSYVWLYGAKKLQWSVGEAEADAERAGCFAEQQLRLGLVVDGATPEYGAWSGSPVERTKWSQTVRFGADRGDGAAPLSSVL